jgi:WD40 repeat protein
VTDVYVSHWDGAGGFAGPVLDALGARLGPGHVAGSGGNGRVRAGSCDVLVALIHTGWAARAGARSDRVHDELTAARAGGALVIPVLLQGVAQPTAADLPAGLRWLAARQHEVIRDEAWQRDLDHLLERAVTASSTRAPIGAANATAVGLARRISAGGTALTGAAFVEGGRVLVVGSLDGTLSLVRAADGQLLRTVRAHPDRLTCLAASPDGTMIATGSTASTVRVWAVPALTEIRRLEGTTTFTSWAHRHFAGEALDLVWSLAFSADSAVVASGQGDGATRLWWLHRGDFRKYAGQADRVAGVAFAPGGTAVASASWDGTIVVRRLSTGAQLARIVDPHLPSPRPGLELAQDLKPAWAVSAVAYSADGRYRAGAAGHCEVRLWRADGGADVAVLTGHEADVMSPYRQVEGLGLGQHAPLMGGVRAVCFSADGALLASGADDHTVRLWRTADGALLQVLQGHSGGVSAVTFTPDGRALASAGWDGEVIMWTVRS